MRKIAFAIIALWFGFVVAYESRAQATCPDLVLNAVEMVGNSCANIGRNVVCYGNHRLDTVLTRPLGIEYFNEPSDQVQLTDLQSLTTSPLNLELNEWGIAVLNLQANVPQALPGQVITFLLIGDVEVRNDAPLSFTNLPTVTTALAASLYNQPDANSAVLNSIDANTALNAVGVTADDMWLRVLYNGEFGWMNRSVVAAELPALPIVDANTPLPMQAFTFRAAIGGPLCAEAPPSVLVMQGPEQVRVNLTVNGARMELGSTVALWQPEDQVLQLAVIDGQVSFDDGTTITTGNTSTIALNEDAQLDGAWQPPRPLTVFEITALLPLETLPESILNYPINVLEEGEATPTPPVTITPTRVYVPPRPTATRVPPSPTPAPQVSFTADAQVIDVGNCTVLRWFTQNIDSLYIDGAPTVGESFLEVCPRQTQTYVLLVNFRDGTQQTYSLTIQVNGPTSTPPSTATPTPICGNQMCEPGEHMLNCTADCLEPVCGNAVCEPYENSCNCGEDCGGTCDIG